MPGLGICLSLGLRSFSRYFPAQSSPVTTGFLASGCLNLSPPPTTQPLLTLLFNLIRPRSRSACRKGISYGTENKFSLPTCDTSNNVLAAPFRKSSDRVALLKNGPSLNLAHSLARSIHHLRSPSRTATVTPAQIVTVVSELSLRRRQTSRLFLPTPVKSGRRLLSHQCSTGSILRLRTTLCQPHRRLYTTPKGASVFCRFHGDGEL
jgi:hypothetical protein